MNYFSHYYVLSDYNDPYLALGSILPDMLRNAKTEFSKLLIDDSQSSEKQFLTNGINSHIEVDKKFHNSKFFLENTKSFAAKIRESEKISMNRYTQFYAHILIELLIDHWLINNHNALLESFYDVLNKVDQSIVNAYFMTNFPSQDFELFWENFANFKKRQYLKDYKSLDNVVAFSFYVYEKATKQTIAKTESNYYISIINSELYGDIEKGARSLFTTLKK